MPEGSCFCGNVRISYEGEPVVKVSYSTFCIVLLTHHNGAPSSS